MVSYIWRSSSWSICKFPVSMPVFISSKHKLVLDFKLKDDMRLRCWFELVNLPMSLNAVSHSPIIRLEKGPQLSCPFFIQRHVHFPWSSPFTSFQAQDVADDFLGKVSNFSQSAFHVNVLILISLQTQIYLGNSLSDIAPPTSPSSSSPPPAPLSLIPSITCP